MHICWLKTSAALFTAWSAWHSWGGNAGPHSSPGTHRRARQPYYGNGVVQVGVLNHTAALGRIWPLGSFLRTGDANLGELSDVTGYG